MLVLLRNCAISTLDDNNSELAWIPAVARMTKLGKLYEFSMRPRILDGNTGSFVAEQLKDAARLD